MALQAFVETIRRFGQPGGYAELRRIERRHRESVDGADVAVPALHWMGAVRLLQGRNREARAYLTKAMAADKLHVDTPIEIYDWLSDTRDAQSAEAFLRLLVEERDAAIFQDIDRHVQHLRTTRYIDYPLDIQIETLARCNAACSFCQYPELTRIGDRMSDEMFEKILGEIESLPSDLPLSITLYGVNEPFLDRRIWDFMGMITARVPHAQIALNTNGAPLTEKSIGRLTDYRIARMSVSVNDYRKADYEDTMKISFDRTLRLLESLNRRRGAGELPFPVGMTRAGDGSIHDLRFIAWANNEYPHLSNNFSPRFDWVSEDAPTGSLSPASGTGCTHWFDMTIRADGQVAFCCIDGHTNWPRGDVTKERLLDIYNKPQYRRMRTDATLRSDLDQCRTCTSG